jgi:hypothetical protein
MKLTEVSKDIKNRTKVLVTGVVDYSHIASKIDGDELKRANEYTNYPSKDPYYKMTIQITETDYTKAFAYDANDQSELTLAAYLGSKVYQSKKEENQGKNYFSAISKGNEVRVFKKGEDGKAHRVQLNGNELAPGSKVQLELQFFETQYGAGVGLNSVVILDSEIKVFEGNNSVKGYETADDTISLPKREIKVVEDVVTNSDSNETPVSDATASKTQAPEVDENPVGSTTAASNATFDDLLKQFKAGNA